MKKLGDKGGSSGKPTRLHPMRQIAEHEVGTGPALCSSSTVGCREISGSNQTHKGGEHPTSLLTVSPPPQPQGSPSHAHRNLCSWGLDHMSEPFNLQVGPHPSSGPAVLGLQGAPRVFQQGESLHCLGHCDTPHPIGRSWPPPHTLEPSRT